MLTVTLLEPQIPPNTGNIARLCAASNTRLEIVGKIGFELTDKYLRRAGLDYWKYVNWEYFPDIDEYIDKLPVDKIHLFTTKAKTSYTQRKFKDGDYFIFGSETAGINEKYLQRFQNCCCTIPMSCEGVRSINLSSSVSIGLYEGLRQIGALDAPDLNLSGIF